jgi:hypothetical protein
MVLPREQLDVRWFERRDFAKLAPEEKRQEPEVEAIAVVAHERDRPDKQDHD